ncbi:hypothetical protein PR048_025695 [Dryococelus australis]|uniref:CABIT domain-containing protein n=1 Tax=Dryococelus australis TaxID=614101 RepID=A0ABQ9GJB1_9NEOP|nr:hypothetical protein PR048_025695 [Dryococelus australis]
MAATDGQIVVAASRWADEGHYLREFVAKYPLPAVVKIIKGQYGGLGVPTLPSPGLQSTALLVSAGRRRKIAAQAVKLKEGRRVAGVGPRLAIPDSYPGYFELLSEEGRSVRCIESVSELARRRLAGGCLVREPVRVLVARCDADGGVTADGARTVAAGETLTPCGEVQLSGGAGSGARGRYLRCSDARGDAVLLGMEQRGRFSALAREDNISGVHTARNLLSKRLPLTVRLVHGPPPRGLKSPSHFVPELRLLSAFEEEHVFALPLQKDAGSAVALPLAAPLKLQRTRNADQLTSMREFQRLAERCSRLAAEAADRIQTKRASEEIWAAFNSEVVRVDEVECEVNMEHRRNAGARETGDPREDTQPRFPHVQIRERPRRESSPVLDGKLGDSKALRAAAVSSGKTGYFLRRSASSDSAASHHNHHHNHHHGHYHRGGGGDENRVPTAHADDYDEIDQIYDYVRGFAPLPKNIRSPFADVSPPPEAAAAPSPPRSPSSTPGHLALLAAPEVADDAGDDKPEPPPIETIPTKKLPPAAAAAAVKAEKRTRRVASAGGKDAPAAPKDKSGKLFIKNGNSQRGRLLRQKSASPLKEISGGSGGGGVGGGPKAGSPLFNIRYKSMSNLHQAMELDGTLDSSQSGGRTSGDSGAGAKLPEKRSRRLSRPRSLTNLVWELRGGGVVAEPPPPPPVKLEPGVHRKNNPSKLIVTGQKRIGTLYL